MFTFLYCVRIFLMCEKQVVNNNLPYLFSIHYLLGDTFINQLLKQNMSTSTLWTHSVSVPLHMSLHSIGNIISSPTHSELLWCLRWNMSTSTFQTDSVSLCICHHCCTSTIVLLFHCSHFVYNSELILAEDPSVEQALANSIAREIKMQKTLSLLTDGFQLLQELVQTHIPLWKSPPWMLLLSGPPQLDNHFLQCYLMNSMETRLKDSPS